MDFLEKQLKWHVMMTFEPLDFSAGSWGRGKRSLSMEDADWDLEEIDNANVAR